MILEEIIRENGYQQAVEEMLNAFPDTPENKRIRDVLWDMAFPKEELTEDQKKQLIEIHTK